MWSQTNQKRIKLSRQLKWSLGKDQNTNKYFWSIGALCLVLAVFLISRTNSILKQEARANPQVLGATTTTNDPEPEIQFVDYKVAKGDTLFTISQKFSLPTETLAQINDIRPPFSVKAGQILKIPQ